jgi:two-component system OmpR family sensor kinase
MSEDEPHRDSPLPMEREERIPAARVFEFLATMAHELRNPMTPILGQVHLLRAIVREEGPLPAKLSRGLERLEAAVEVFMRRATTLLEVSRIASGHLELHPAPADLSALTTETIERYAPLAAMARTSITLNAPPSVTGFWDKGALEQILENLISNAFKYADQKPIDVAIVCDKDKVRIDVRDRGIGMENPEFVFDKFLKAESSGGFGVGLWVVRHLCEAMEGSVRVKSKPGHGSTFTVTLPRHGAGAP